MRLVKTLNSTTAALMVNPAAVGGGDHTMFVAGNDAEAKAKALRHAWLADVQLQDRTVTRHASSRASQRVHRLTSR